MTTMGPENSCHVMVRSTRFKLNCAWPCGAGLPIGSEDREELGAALRSVHEEEKVPQHRHNVCYVLETKDC